MPGMSTSSAKPRALRIVGTTSTLLQSSSCVAGLVCASQRSKIGVRRPRSKGERFERLSTLVASASGRPIAWQKSLVGQGAFTHEAGVHVDGLIKDRLNYQGVDPHELGRDHTLVLGKHSGTRAVQRSYANLGLVLDRPEAERILEQIRSYVTRFKRPPGNSELVEFYHSLSACGERAVCL